MLKPKVLVTRPDLPVEAIQRLKERCDVEISPIKPILMEDLRNKISDKDGLICHPNDSINKSVIEAAEHLKVISNLSLDHKNVEQNLCKQRGIAVTSANPNVKDAIAEITIALLIGCGRGVFESSEYVKNGKWKSDIKYHRGADLFCGKGILNSIIGIYYPGEMSECLIERIKCFKPAKILYHNENPIPIADELGAVRVDFQEFLEASDFIIDIGDQDKVKAVFNHAAFCKMKKNAIFISTYHGETVNQKDLYDALKNKVIRAAALDTTFPEPPMKDDALLSLPNIVVTPHIGHVEKSVKTEIAMMAVTSVLKVLFGEDDCPEEK